MDKHIYIKTFSIIIILVFIFCSMHYIIYAETYSHKDTIKPGTEFIIPTEIDQYTAQWESYAKADVSKQPGRSSGTAQYDVRQLWEEQNKPVADNGVAYIEVAGQKRYIVALATTFGWSGDYIDIVLHNGEIVPCIIGDSKSEHTDTPYYHTDKVFYGHKYGDNECDIVEFILGIDIEDRDTPPILGEFLKKFDKVKSIKNGGSYFLHKDGPVGLSGDYIKILPGTWVTSSETSKNNNSDGDDQSFARTFGRFLRNGWIAISTFFDNDRTGRNLSTIMISLSN